MHRVSVAVDSRQIGSYCRCISTFDNGPVGISCIWSKSETAHPEFERFKTRHRIVFLIDNSPGKINAQAITPYRFKGYFGRYAIDQVTALGEELDIISRALGRVSSGRYLGIND